MTQLWRRKSPLLRVRAVPCRAVDSVGALHLWLTLVRACCHLPVKLAWIVYYIGAIIGGQG